MQAELYMKFSDSFGELDMDKRMILKWQRLNLVRSMMSAKVTVQ
jgi:hypothetical protein